MSADVLVVEDEPRFASLVSTLLESASFRVHVAHDAREARDLARTIALRASVVDLGLPDGDGIALIRFLAEHGPQRPILVLSGARAPSSVIDALRAGASGYLLKEDAVRRLVPALDELLDGGAPLSAHAARAVVAALRDGASGEAAQAIALTARERDVLRELARGLTYEQVACVLDVSVNTVRTRVKTLYEKLDACSRTEAVLAAMRHGLLAAS